jgi:3-deoxy-D-manno-octulosonic acid kinase
MTLSVISKQQRHLIVDTHFSQALNLQPDFDWFNPEYWRSQKAIRATASGRGTTYFVQQDKHTLVLRHYRRGGMIRHVSEDSFLYSGIKNTRPWQELSLLNTMNQIGLAVPVGIAGFVERKGLTFKADIITLCIDDSQDIHTKLCQGPVHDDNWKAIGRVIRDLHNAQVYHHDLNIHNILQDASGKVWVIDFDKCKTQTGDGWKQDNLDRLKRSLDKEMTRENAYHFTEQNWQALLSSYHS